MSLPSYFFVFRFSASLRLAYLFGGTFHLISFVVKPSGLESLHIFSSH